MTKMNVIEFEDFWIFPVENLTVSQLRIEYSMGINLWTSQEFYFNVVIEAPFQFINSNQEMIRVTPETLEGVCSILDILHETVQSAIAYKNGTLELVFKNGHRIIAKPDYMYEAWNISGPAGLLFVCKPNGEVESWSSNNRR